MNRIIKFVKGWCGQPFTRILAWLPIRSGGPFKLGLPVAAACLLAGNIGLAQSLYWDANGATPGSGGPSPTGTWDGVSLNWNMNSSGTGPTTTWVPGDTAIFSAGSDATGNYTVTLAGPQSVGGLSFTSGLGTLTGGSLTLGGAGTVSVNAPPVKGVIASSIGGSIGLTKQSSGELVLAAANTFSGSLSIQQGMVTLNNSAAASTGTIALNPANSSSVVSLTSSNAAITIGNNLSLGGSSLGTIQIAPLTNTVLTLNGVISGNHGWSVNGPGTVVLSGSTPNTFTTLFAVLQGTVVVTADGALGTIGNGTVVSSGATLALAGGVDYATVEGVTLNGAGVGGNGALQGRGGMNTFEGTILLGSDTVMGAQANSELLIVNPVTSSGTANLAITNTGTVALTGGGNVYSNTLVAAGTLEVDLLANAGTGLVTVNAGGTLTGNDGVAPGGVNLSGTIAPAGTLFSGGQTWNPGGTYVWEIQDAADASVNDLLDISAGLTNNATAGKPFTISIVSLDPNTGNPGAPGSFDNTRQYDWLIASTASGIFGNGAANLTINASQFASDLGGGSFRVLVVGADLMLEFDPAPVISCPGTITQGNDLGQCSASVQFAATAATYRNFSPVTISYSTNGVPITSPCVFPVGTTTVNALATDAVGDTATCSFAVTVNDTQPPTVVTKNAIKTLDANGNATLSAADIDGGSSDNCSGVVSLLIGPSETGPWTATLPYNCTDVGAHTVYLQATDVAGNSAARSAQVTISDTTVPTAVAKNIDVNLSASSPGTVTVAAADINNGSSDNCGISQYLISKDHGANYATSVSFDCDATGAQPVTLKVIDGSGNFNTATATVTVHDVTPPTISGTPANIYVTDPTGQGNVTVSWTAPTASDNCSATLSTDHQPGVLFPDGVTTVTYTATDPSNNKTTSSFTVTVVVTTNTYVDASYAGQSTGTQVIWPLNGGTGIHYIGYDAFATIQGGVNAVASGGTVNVAAGTYTEDLNIDQPLSLLGPNANINPNTGTRVAEATIYPATSDPDPNDDTYLVSVTASGVTIKGFTVNGDNPNLTSGTILRGADLDASEGIGNATTVSANTVANNIVVNFVVAGIDFANGSSATTGNYIQDNRIGNIGYNWPGYPYGYGIGILLYNNFYAEVSSNVIYDAVVGIQTGNFYVANPGTIPSISDNTITSTRRGIFHNLQYQGASPFTISNNLVSAESDATVVRWDGITLSSIGDSVGAVVTNNTVIGGAVAQPTVGYQIWSDLTTLGVTVGGGSVRGANYGVWVNNYQGYGPRAGTSTLAIINGVTISGASFAGVYVQDDPLAANGSVMSAMVTGNTIINGSTTGVLVQGANALAKIQNNTAANTGNSIGVQVDTGKALLQNNNLTGNSVAAIVATNGASVDAGNCGTDMTGLGGSTGGNILTGYLSGNPYAIVNNASTVDAFGNDFGASAMAPSIAGALSGTVSASQSGGLFALPPNAVTVQCPGEITSGVITLGDFIKLDGVVVSATAGVTVSPGDSAHPSANGSVTRTYTLTPTCGNGATVTQIITVQETTPPTVLVKSTLGASLSAGAPGTVTVNAQDIDSGSSSYCGGPLQYAISESQSGPWTASLIYDCSHTGLHTVYLQVTDAAGLASISPTATTVNVQDVTPPTVVFNSIAVQLDATGNYTLTPSDIAAIANGSSDNCSIANESVSPSSFTFCDAGTKPVTLTVTDGSGLSTQVQGSLTVNRPANPPATVYVDAGFGTGCGPVSFPNTAGTGTYYVGYNAFASVQAGVNAVATGGTVNVAAGTYVEQVEIARNLTLNGAGAATIIQSPAILTKYYTTSADNKPVVYVHDASAVTVENLTVDGAGQGNANYRFQGVGYYQAGGLIENLLVKGVRETPINGDQHGNAIYAYNAISPMLNVEVSGCQVYDFQKNGITINGGDLVGNVHGNTVTGAGAVDFTAQNGIQFGFGATGTIQDNTVSGFTYTLAATPQDDACGILIYTSSATIGNNSVTDCQYGVGLYNPLASMGGISDNDFSADVSGVNDYSDTPVVNVNVAGNWWGDVSGPSSTALNPYGAGSGVSTVVGDNLVVAPWLGSGANTQPGVPGFYPNPAPTENPPAQLVFTTEPGGVALGNPLAPQPVVAIEDASGNVTPWVAAPVAIAIQANPTGNGVLTGTLSQTPVAGVATFNDLVITIDGGSGYTLTASVLNLPAINSSAFDIGNPLPVITSLTPAWAVAGDAGFTLTVNGANFVKDSVVRWNGSARATTYSSPTQVTAAITSTDIAGASSADVVTIFNTTPGGGESTPATSFPVYGVPAAVYVNSSYNSGAGNDGHRWGYDAFSTIQAGINRVASGGTVNVAAGTYGENVTASKAVTLLGANQGVAGCGSRGPESIVGPGMGNAITITANNVVVDGFELNGVESVQDSGQVGVAIQNNTMTAAAVGVDVRGIATTAGASFTLQNNCITLASQMAGSAPTIGVGLSSVTGPQAPVMQNNHVQGAFYGYLLYGLNAGLPTVVQGGFITNVMQGVAIWNLNPATLTDYSSSTFGVNGVTVSGFTGNYPSSPNNNLHAGVYVYSGGSDQTALLTGTINNVTVTGTGKISPDSSGLDFADFSSGAGVRQQITVQNCNISTNENRGIFCSGANLAATVTGSTVLGNGFDPYGTGGNYGYGIIARNNSQVTIMNCFVANPAASPYSVTAIEADANTAPQGPTVVAVNNSVVNNGNLSGKLAGQDAGTLNASGNWWGTTSDTTIASLVAGTVDFTPYLDSGTDTDSATAGFQGDFSTLHVTTLGAQTGNTGRIQEGINTVAGGTVLLQAGTFVEGPQILINKAVVIAGDSMATTVVKPTGDTSNSGDTKGWWLVQPKIHFNLSKLTLDGTGRLVFQAIRSYGLATIDQVHFTHIRYNPSGPDYAGTGVVAFDDGNANDAAVLNVSNCQLDNIGRIGIFYYGNTTGICNGNTYAGKGNGNWLDYGVEVGAGASAVISTNTITGDTGVATIDGSTSAGVAADTYYGDGTKAIVRGNIIAGNSYGVAVGYEDEDTSDVLIEGNDLRANATDGIQVVGGATVDAGDCTGGNATGLGSSAGGNNLSGYGFDGAAPWAIENLNSATQPVLAYENIYGAAVGNNLASLFYGNVLADQSGGLLVQYPAGSTFECLGSVPSVANSLEGFVAQGGAVSATAATVSPSDAVVSTTLNNRVITRTYTLTDACGQTAQGTQTFTVADTIAPTVTTWPASRNLDVGGQCNAGIPDLTLEVYGASDNCGTVHITQNPAAGTVVSLGTTNVVVTVADDGGNSVSATVVLTVVDSNPPNATYVDRTYANLPAGTAVKFPNGGSGADHYVGCDAFATIEDGINRVAAGGTVNVAPGIYNEAGQIVIAKPLSLAGVDKTVTVLKPSQDTSGDDSNDNRDSSAWLLVEPGINFNLSGVTLDGSGHAIWDGIRHQGSGCIGDCIFTNLQYTPGSYRGTAIAIHGTGTVNVTNSLFTAVGRVGVAPYDASFGAYNGNTYIGKGPGDWLDYAFVIQYGATIALTNNQIFNNVGVAASDLSDSAGIAVWDDPGTVATLVGNGFTNNTDGLAVAIWTGGSAPTVNVGDGNVFNGGATGVNVQNALGYYSGTPVTASPTITFGASTYIGQSTDAIYLDTDISAGAVFDISQAVFKDASGNLVTDNFAKEDLVYHAIDAEDRGLLVWNPNNVYVTPNSGSIQRGVNAAVATGSGYTVNVAPGTFVEQVEIADDITLNGSGAATIIQSPATLPLSFSALNHTYKPIVYVHAAAADPTVENLTVDGHGQGTGNYEFVGVAYYQVSGTVQNVTVKNIQDTVMDGNQSGHGIVGYADAAPCLMTVTGCNVSYCQKNGIMMRGATLTATVTGNTVVGAGPVNFIAQNGIEFAFGATGSIQDNTVSGFTYTPAATPQDDACGILIYQGSATISNNSVRNCQYGVGLYEPLASMGVISDNDFSADVSGVNDYSDSTVVTVNVANNWWGDVSGPSSGTLNPYGIGSGASTVVGDNLVVAPWLGSGANTQSGVPGFYPNPTPTENPPAQLVFITEPAGTVVGSLLGTQPVVAIEDASGNVTPWVAAPVAIAIQKNPTGNGVLTGTSSQTSVAGVATFSDLTITGDGGPGYTLAASAPHLPTTTSSAFDISNPLPSITSLAPTWIEAGSQGFSLTVNGANFVYDSKVYWNGSLRPTMFVNANQLTASISADDVVNAGLTNVTVLNVAPGGGESAPATFNIYAVPAVVYVNPSYTSDGIDDSHLWGYDAFTTIQAGVNAVAPGGTVNVAAGTYAENVLLNKSATLLGPNATVDPNNGSRVAEAILVPSAVETSAQGSTAGVLIRIGNATGHVDAAVNGFILDGHNGNLTGGVTLNGVEIDTGAGIVNSTGSFDMNPGSFDTTVVVQNNIIQNLERYGVLLDSTPASTPNAGNDVSHNKIDNLPSGDNFGGNRGRGVAFEDNTYGTCAFNVMTRVNVGWQDDNYWQASPGAGTLVASNTIATYHRGIFHNLQYDSATSASILGNNISVETSGDYPASASNFGIELASIQIAVGATVSGNNVTNNNYGILLWNIPSSGAVVVSGGTVSGNQIGIWATSQDPQFGAGQASQTVISNVTVVNATVAGVEVDDSTGTASTKATVNGNTVVSGSPLGIYVNGAAASVVVSNNSATITGNGVGISVDAGKALIENNDLRGNRVAAISLANNAVVDAGNCGTDMTGLGGGTGGNNLSGYLAGNPYAIVNGGGTVFAFNNDFGANAMAPSIAGALSGTVSASQSGGLFALPPTTVVVQCPGDIASVPSATTLEGFINLGGVVSATAGVTVDNYLDSAYPAGNGPATRTYTLTPTCGNAAKPAQTITVLNTTPPAITQTPANVSVSTGPGRTSCDQVATWDAATATCSCAYQSPVAIVYYLNYGQANQAPVNSGDLFPVGQTTVTVLATDAANNSSTSTFTVTVTDTTPPVITHTPANVNVETGAGRITCDQVASWEPASATDNCGGSVTIGYYINYGQASQAQVNSGDTFPIGQTTVTVLARDDVNNSSTSAFTVTVSDTTPPVVTWPADVTVNRLDSTDPYATGTPAATDVCNGSPTVSYDDDRSTLDQCDATGYITRTWTVMGAYNNSVSKTQKITVQDTIAPVITNFVDITNTDGGNCTAVVNFAPVAMDLGYQQDFENPVWVSGPAANAPSVDWNQYTSQIYRVTSLGGIQASSGSAFAVIDSTGLTGPARGGGLNVNQSGIFSRLGGYSGTFGAGFRSAVDVYIDLNDPTVAANGYGFDVDTANASPSLGYGRDFVFHVASDAAGEILVAADNGSSQSKPDLTSVPGHGTIATSGWYTFEWIFRNNSGVLAVDLNLRNASGNLVWTQTLSDPSDLIPSVVGGNRYMWFNYVTPDKLAIDNTILERYEPVTSDIASGFAFPVGPTTVHLSASDACGNSTNSSFTVTVQHVSTMTLATSGTPGIYGTEVTFTASIPACALPPTGAVTFNDGSTVVGVITLDGTAQNGMAQAVLMTSALTAGSHQITAAYSGDSYYTAITSAVLTQDIQQATLTVTGITAMDKVYDGGAGATLSVGGALLNGVVTGDDVTLDTTAAIGAFGDKVVGLEKTVTISGLVIGGSAAGNYSLTQPATTASIGALHITGAFTASGKVYDGNNSATVLTRTLAGALVNDEVSLAGGTATFNDRTAAHGKTVTLAGAILAGGDAPNYALDSVATTTADITAASVIPSITAASKTYDGTTAATITSWSLSGFVPGDSVTLGGGTATFDGSGVGNHLVTAGGFTLSGGDAGNYVLSPSTATTSASITAASLTITANDDSKTYGQTKNYGAGSTAFTTIGTIYPGDALSSVTLASDGAAATAIAGSYDIVPSAAVGNGLSNYNISYVKGTLTVAQMTPNLTISSATAIQYSQPLSASTISGSASNPNNSSSVDGTFSFTTPDTVPLATGNQGVTFTPGDTGNYTTATGLVSVTVIDPAIFAQPTNITVPLGSNATFSVTAAGSGTLSYQWQENGVDLPGATSSNLMLNGVTDSAAGQYIVVVSNANGVTNSLAVTLTITHPPRFVTQPASLVVNQGGTASFAVSVDGAIPFTYQWLKNGTPVSDGGTVSGATAKKLIISNVTSNDTASYSVSVANSDGTNSSLGATLVVIVPPAITSQPAGLTNNAGTTAIFSVTNSGSASAYYWYKNGTDLLSDGGKISGSATAVLTITNVLGADSGTYDVVISNAAAMVTSTNASLLVIDPIITIEPASITNNAGTVASFTVAAYGTAPEYQWFKNGFTIPGAMAATYSIASVADLDVAGYSVVVSNSFGMVTSAPPASLTVIDPPKITGEPQPLTVNATAGATFAVTYTGTSPSIQWFVASTPISGATGATLTLNHVSQADAQDYTVVLTNAAGSVTSTPPAHLTVIDPPVLTQQPVSITNNAGTTVTFTVAASGTSPAYQWYQNGTNALVTGGNVYGATSATLTLSNVFGIDGAVYSVVASNAAATQLSSNATLTVIDPILAAQPVGVTNIQGSTAVFAVTAIGTTPMSYQWYQDGDILDGETDRTLTLDDIADSDAGAYTVVVTNSYGNVTSTPALLVTVPPLIIMQPASVVALRGDSVSFSVSVNGATPFNYQWLKNGTNVSGALSRILSFSSVAVSDTGTYRVAVTNPNGTQMSDLATLSVYTSAVPILTITDSDPLAAVTLTGVPTFTYVIQGSTNLVNWVPFQTNVSPFTFTETNSGQFKGRFYRGLYLHE